MPDEIELLSTFNTAHVEWLEPHQVPERFLAEDKCGVMFTCKEGAVFIGEKQVKKLIKFLER